MRQITLFLATIILVILSQNLNAQRKYERKIEVLEAQKEKIANQEKEALKLEVKDINKRLDRGEISLEKANELKKEAAKNRALNIENKLAIIDNQIALLERNKSDIFDEYDALYEEQIDFFEDENVVLGLRIKKTDFPKPDKRTKSNVVLGIGLNNTIIQGQSLIDTPHQILGSRYFEMGYQWTTRVFRNSNWLRITYGINYLSRGLKTDNQLFARRTTGGFIEVGGERLQIIDLVNANAFFNNDTGELAKSKFRQDDIIIPFHFELGSSAKRSNGNFVRYSTKNKFRFGLGFYAGFNIKTVQKIRFNPDFIPNGVSTDFETLVPRSDARDAFFGLSTYIGRGNVTWHLKYDIDRNFALAINSPRRNNISLGLRFDL
ncbi:hypothetical protein [Flagellimonas sp.]|uniref:hypothetical protein n=1 Tax=Flagellimonas sp. TaxID=2058762 RepID=UPI003F49B604